MEIERVREQPVSEIVRLTGTVTSARAASLSPATTGLVTHVVVDAGDRVQAGDVLVTLDDELARWQSQSAQAARQAAGIALNDARRRLQEARALAPQASIAETVVHDLAAEVDQDEAALQQATAEAGFRAAVLERHQLRAPFDGVVAAKLTEVGEWVTPGDAVLQLVATDDLRMDFATPETYLNRIAVNDPISFTTAAARSDSYTGSVTAVVPVSDPGARTFLLRATADKQDAQLSPGMAVHAQVALNTNRRAPVVPRDAIIRYPDGRVIVWVVDTSAEEHVVREQLIQPGLSFDGVVEIRSGLAAGEPVVVKGNESLLSGQRVKVLERQAD